MITYRDLDTAWWRWAASKARGSHKMPAIDRLVDVPFAYDGTDWTVKREVRTSASGIVLRRISIYIGSDGRIVSPSGYHSA
jgi:hypothetical protein